jgi:hypothetical protein
MAYIQLIREERAVALYAGTDTPHDGAQPRVPLPGRSVIERREAP